MPRLRLNALNVATLRAVDGRRTDYHDAVQRGLVLRVSPTGARVWIVRYRLGRVTRRYRLGPLDAVSLATARRQAQAILGEVARGIDPHLERAASRRVSQLTVVRLCERYISARTLAPNSERAYRLALERIRAAIGDLPADQLRRARARLLGESIRDAGAPVVANRTLDFLRTAYRWAVRQELLAHSPLDGLEAPAPESSRDRVLAPDELRAVCLALAEHDVEAADMVRLLLLTLARRREVAGMRVSELEHLDQPARAQWVVPAERMKGRRAHVVPLSPEAVAIVRRRLRPDSRRVFQTRDIHVTFWERLHREADAIAGRTLKRWTLHDLRRTAATRLREDLGARADVVSLLLAHRPARVAAVTSIYDRSELLAERRAALASWGRWLRQIASAEPSKIAPFRGHAGATP